MLKIKAESKAESKLTAAHLKRGRAVYSGGNNCFDMFIDRLSCGIYPVSLYCLSNREMQRMSREWLEHKPRPIQQRGVAVCLFCSVIKNGELFPETLIPLRGAMQVFQRGQRGIGVDLTRESGLTASISWTWERVRSSSIMETKHIAPHKFSTESFHASTKAVWASISSLRNPLRKQSAVFAPHLGNVFSVNDWNSYWHFIPPVAFLSEFIQNQN